MIIIEHETKKIMPCDIKTLGDYVLNFRKHMKKRRYDVQGAFYKSGIEFNRASIGDIIGKSVTDYEVANFAFIVESTTRPGCPLVFVMDDNLIQVGRRGNEDNSLMGYKEGLEIFKAWSEVEFSLERKYEATNGVLMGRRRF